MLDLARGEHSPGLSGEREAVAVAQDLQPRTWSKGLAQAELVGGGCKSLTWLFLPQPPVDLLLGAVLLYKILKYETGRRPGTQVSQEISSTTRL